jgi:lipopolysaccharide export system permease protein
MPFRILTLDRYILGQILGTMGSVLAVVMSLMLLEHLPRLLQITSQSGHRAYIVAQTVAGLLPEYGGIGLPVGLLLGIALTIRKLALRGELDVIEACGIAPSRWMRFPLALSALVSILILLNQGWIAPAGEAKLAEIGRRMADGEFGHRLQAGEFIALGSGSTLLFEKVDAVNGELIGLFLRVEGKVFTARRGKVWQLPSGATAIELRDGQVLQERDARVLEFAHFEYRVDEVEGASDNESTEEVLKRVDIGLLWANSRPSSRSVVYGRCLWAALVLFVPLLALILGKPPRRQSGAVGILLGVIFLVLGLKMIAPLIDGHSSEPELLAAGILATWGLFVSGLIKAERVFGQGFVDLWASRIFYNIRRSNEKSITKPA